MLRLITEMKRSNSGPQLGRFKGGAKEKKLNGDGCLVRRRCFGISVAMRQRVASSDGETISMALRKRKHIRRASNFRLVSFGHCSHIYFPNPILSYFSFANNFTFNYSRRHITTLYVASRLVSTLLHALLWEPKVFGPI